MLISNIPKIFWQVMMARQTYYTAATMDVRGAGLTAGKENGLYALFWNDDFFRNAIGGETRRNYLVTSPGSNFIYNGNIGGAGTLYSIVNYVAPGGGVQARQNTAMLTGGQ
jgi:hypothetical protein